MKCKRWKDHEFKLKQYVVIDGAAREQHECRRCKRTTFRAVGGGIAPPLARTFNQRVVDAKHGYIKRRAPQVILPIDAKRFRDEMALAFASGAVWAQRTINRLGRAT